MAQSPYRLRPSGMSRTVACPGSVQMEEKFPQLDETDAAKEGTAAHECFYMEYHGVPYTVGATASNGVIIDAEMLEAGSEFCDRLRTWQTQYLYVEQQMACSSIHSLCGGTPDAWGWFPELSLIRVADMKYGHRDVEVIDNYQFASYTSGISDILQINGLQEQYIWVEWSIYQPRSYRSGGPWKVHTMLLSDLRALFNKMRAACNEALTDTARCMPSAECRDCLGRHACVALQKASASVIDFVAGTLEDLTLNDVQAGSELTRLCSARAVLEARIEGLEEQALSAIKKGRRVPGWEVKHSSGREKWREGKEAEVLALAQLLSFDLLKPRELITPTQARQKGFDVDSLDASFKPAGGAKLVPASTIETAKIFGANKNG